MDFKHLVESGQYSREDLDEVQNAYVDGQDDAIDDLCSLYDQIKDELSEDDGSISLMNQMKLEIIKEFIDEATEYLEGSICQYIVEMSDNNMSQQESQYEPQPLPQQLPEPEPEMEQPQRTGRMSRSSRAKQQSAPQPQSEPRYPRNNRGGRF